MNNKKYWARRLKNKTFWVSLVSSVFLLTQLCGFDLSFLHPNLESIVNVLLTILTILGVLNDPTNTSGVFIDSVDENGNGIPDELEIQEEQNENNDQIKG